MSDFKFFKGSLIVTIIGIILAFMIGGMQGVFIAGVLSIMEVSLSFDNAVVNAKVLEDMSDKWRHRFITWGMLIAVFGMRILFPIILVSIVAGITPWNAFDIAINSPDQYKHYMELSHTNLMGFGASFLILVGLDFFLDDSKEHWIPLIEQPLSKLSNIPHLNIIIVFLVVLITSHLLPNDAVNSFFISCVSGVGVFMAIHYMSSYMEAKEEARAAIHNTAKSGLMMFIYLEVLDSSFSFDGVIGAFAISSNIFLIAVGLGIGAMFVRSLTLLLVEKGTLTEYKWLEHGAFYAIIALSSIMFIKTFYEVPEIITGLIGAGFISIAFIHSLLSKDS